MTPPVRDLPRALLAWLRERSVAGFGDGVMVFKTVLAAGLSWWVAASVLDLSEPGLAPTGAVLVAQVTPHATALKSFQRAAGIVAGVLLGAAVAALSGNGLVTILLVTLLGMFAGRLMRLGPQMHQVALTGILVVSSSEHLGYGTARIEENVLGVLVGTATALLVPSPGFTRKARTEIGLLTREMAALLSSVATDLPEEAWPASAAGWVREARRLSVRLDTVRSAVRQAHEASRWRRKTGAAAVARLAEAATALDHVGHQLRGITRGLYNLTYREGRPPALHREQPDSPLKPLEAPPRPEGLDRVLHSLALVLTEIADRHLKADGPAGTADPQTAPQQLRQLLGEAEARFLATAIGQSSAYGRWQTLCTAGILEDTRKMLHELDPDLGPHHAAFT
ncbi:FUSC family protein [Streptomyces sp. NPDC097619]|uniref:FUSC family protein n=1 Tax=Streptomyces sp. NPDC097619 TaxID=3157228 RepID=UPI003320F4C0